MSVKALSEISFGLNGGGNGTKNLAITGTSCIRFKMPIPFLVVSGSFDTDVVFPAGASCIVNILKNGVTAASQTFNTAASNGGSFTSFTPVSFAAGDILQVQVVQASFAGGPNLSVFLLANI